MPIQLKYGYLVIAKGSIANLSGLTFVVDTGTSRTIIDSRVARQLGLTGVAHRLTIFDHEAEVRLVSLPDLNLGAIRVESPSVIAADLAPIGKSFGFYPDAILGTDILRLSNFTIDYRSRRIWFGTEEPTASGLSSPPESAPYLIVQARVNDSPVRLMIDTGCEDVVLFSNRLPHIIRKSELMESRVLTFAGKWPPSQNGSVKLAVGASPAHNVTLHVVDTGSNDMGYDGIVGRGGLHASRIYFDFERMRVSWK